MRRTIAHSSLSRRYGADHMTAFHLWVGENTECLPGSKHPSQITACVARFLWFSTGGTPFDEGVWKNIHRPDIIEEWIRRQNEAGMQPSTIYNYLGALNMADTFCYAVQRINAPSNFAGFMQRKTRLYRRRKNAQTRRSIDIQQDAGPLSLRPLVDFVLNNPKSGLRMKEAVSASKSGTMCADDFLFALRLAMLHMITSIGARASAIYTLTVGHLNGARGSWKDLSPIVIKNPHHKTGSTHGPAHLVLSGRGKMMFRLYFMFVRRAACREWSIAPSHVFFNTQGKPLVASTINTNIKALQRYCDVRSPVCTTDIRKTTTTLLRQARRTSPDRQGAIVASALCHTLDTSNKHYRLNNKSDYAIKVHLQIKELLGLL